MAETCRHRVTTRAGCWTRCGSAGSPRWSWQWPTLMTPSPGSRCSHTCSAAGAASTRPTSTPGNPGQARQQETHQPNRRSSSGAKDPENRNRLWGHLKNTAKHPISPGGTSPRTVHRAVTAHPPRGQHGPGGTSVVRRLILGRRRLPELVLTPIGAFRCPRLGGPFGPARRIDVCAATSEQPPPLSWGGVLPSAALRCGQAAAW